MADNSNQYSAASAGSSGAGGSGSSSSKGSSSGGSSAAVSSTVQQYLLSQEDCQTLFQAEPISSLDLYLLDRCSGDTMLKIPTEAMDDTGVSFSFNYDGDILTSASIANDYYRITNATVDISFTLRWHQVLNEIKALILPGETSTENGKTKHAMTRNLLRRRPKSFIVLAVAEGETPDPSNAESGSLLFPNVSLDYANGFTLDYNPNDPLELETNLTARFTRGVDGTLAVMWY